MNSVSSKKSNHNYKLTYFWRLISCIFFGRSIAGRRVRVEPSNGMSRRRGGRDRGPSRRGRPFHPDDRCYQCGERGHYARDCKRYRRGGRSRR